MDQKQSLNSVTFSNKSESFYDFILWKKKNISFCFVHSEWCIVRYVVDCCHCFITFCPMMILLRILSKDQTKKWRIDSCDDRVNVNGTSREHPRMPSQSFCLQNHKIKSCPRKQHFFCAFFLCGLVQAQDRGANPLNFLTQNDEQMIHFWRERVCHEAKLHFPSFRCALTLVGHVHPHRQQACERRRPRRWAQGKDATRKKKQRNGIQPLNQHRYKYRPPAQQHPMTTMRNEKQQVGWKKSKRIKREQEEATNVTPLYKYKYKYRPPFLQTMNGKGQLRNFRHDATVRVAMKTTKICDSLLWISSS